MKRLVAISLFFGLVSAAQAQMPSPPATPSQLAIQVVNVINSWALTLEAQQREIADLRAQIKALKDKYEKPAAPPK